jgi:hypothetical protein
LRGSHQVAGSDPMWLAVLLMASRIACMMKNEIAQG